MARWYSNKEILVTFYGTRDFAASLK